MKRRLQLPEVQSRSFVPEGGLDLVTPLLLLKDGAAFDARNYECNLIAGYSRIAGYDTYLGGKTPSEMDFRLCTISVVGGRLKSGDSLKGSDSGATMTVGASLDGHKHIDAYSLNEQIYATDVVGIFIVGETLTHLNGTATTVMVSPPEPLPGANDAEVMAARAIAEETVRNLMDRPGSGEFVRYQQSQRIASGPVLGVFVLDDVTHVAKARADLLHFGSDVCFVRPETDPLVSANRSWELAAQTTIPSPNAKFEFRRSNFHAPAGPQRIFGVSGTSKAFMFDGTSVSYITTGMADDTPDHLEIHANRLFLAFGSSLQYSPINDPFAAWTVVLGANEISTGSPITGLLSMRGDSGSQALLISTKEKLWILYGNSQLDFQLVQFASHSGALASTLVNMGQPIFQNMFGIARLSETQKFGGFEASAISDKIKPFVDARRGLASAAMVCRDKNQYRIFYSDRTAVYATFRDGRPIGMFTIHMRHKVTSVWSDVLSDDTELMLIGTEDGQLFKMDVGTSFAGHAIHHHIRFAFNHLGSPRIDKHFMRATVELQAKNYVNVQVGYDLDYGNSERGVTPYQELETGNQGGRWDQGTWDVGYWDAATATPMTVDTPGTGNNVSLRFRGADNVTHPFTLPAILLDFTVRKKRRA